jgi:hypothetical protein
MVIFSGLLRGLCETTGYNVDTFQKLQNGNIMLTTASRTIYVGTHYICYVMLFKLFGDSKLCLV